MCPLLEGAYNKEIVVQGKPKRWKFNADLFQLRMKY